MVEHGTSRGGHSGKADEVLDAETRSGRRTLGQRPEPEVEGGGSSKASWLALQPNSANGVLPSTSG